MAFASSFHHFHVSLLLILIFVTLTPTNCKLDPESWDAKLPSTKLPKFLRHRVPSLGSKAVQKFLSYIQNGILSFHSKAFCEASHLACNPDAPFSNATIPLYLENSGSSGLTDLYFRKSHVQVGQLITLPNLHSDMPSRPFLPQALAKKLPFRNKTLPSLLEMLNISSNSPLAKHMQETLFGCEKQQKKQTKACVTSLEEMADFVRRKLGSHLDILQTSWRHSLSHRNVIVRNMSLKGSPTEHKAIVCSDTVFPYSVFNCFVVNNVKNLEVTLETEGSKYTTKAVMQCSTVKWHVIEDVTFIPLLRGEEAELCHWMSDHDIVFVNKDREETEGKEKLKKTKKKKVKVNKKNINERKGERQEGKRDFV